jgi:hypothetical protein
MAAPERQIDVILTKAGQLLADRFLGSSTMRLRLGPACPEDLLLRLLLHRRIGVLRMRRTKGESRHANGEPKQREPA